MGASLKRLFLVWAALLALLGATIGASFVPMGPALPAVTYGIAIAKTALVLWFFMELRREPGLARLAGLAGFAWIAFLLIMVAADLSSRGWVGT